MTPKISVIIPVYNTEAYLPCCLDSLQAQSFTDFEAILVNDGSTDRSEEICNSYATRDGRFHLFSKDNGGVSSARNMGLDLAEGETVCFVDSDDWLPDNSLELLFNAHAATGADLVVANMVFVNKGKSRKIRVFDKPFTTTDKSWILQYERACIGYGYNPCPGTGRKSAGLGSMGNKLYKRELIERHRLRFDLDVLGIYEDNLFVLNYLEHCEKLTYIEESVYNYRKVDGSNSRGFKPNTLEINQRIFAKITAFIKVRHGGDFEDFQKAFYMYVIRRLEVSLSTYFFASDNNASFLKRLRELHALLVSEPYSTAIDNVEYKLLKPNNRITWLAAKTRSAFLLWSAKALGGFGSWVVRQVGR